MASDGESDVNTNFIPKLEGASNYAAWIDAFEVFCLAKDPQYLDIYTGTCKPATSTPIEIAPEESRIRAATSLDKSPETVTKKELAHWTKVNVTEPNNDLRSWTLKNATLVFHIHSCITEAAFAKIYSETSASEINAIFIREFYRITGNSWVAKVGTLMGVQYEPGMQAGQFVDKFNRARDDVINYMPDQVSPPMLYAILINGILARPGMTAWAKSRRPDLTSPKVVDTTIDSFMEFAAGVQWFPKTPFED